ncbi:MAG: hypothetical protein U0350_38465 [Caldilineaceae bacterium]
MSPQFGQAAFRLGIFIVLVAGILLFFEPSGTAEQAISILTLIIGLLFLGVVAIWVWISQRKS